MLKIAETFTLTHLKNVFTFIADHSYIYITIVVIFYKINKFIFHRNNAADILCFISKLHTKITEISNLFISLLGIKILSLAEDKFLTIKTKKWYYSTWGFWIINTNKSRNCNDIGLYRCWPAWYKYNLGKR